MLSGSLSPMRNRDTTAAWAYHDATKHSVASVHRSRHGLDFEIMPRPFKVYPQLAPIPLPRDFTTATRPALAAIAHDGVMVGDGPALDQVTLARLLYFTAGVLRRRSYPGGEAFFRAQACTGNLHHIDLYLICGALPELAAGVYHFSPHDFALRQLRAGDVRAAVLHASADEAAIAGTPAILACTSTFWRNAWKYQARTYRHCFWDNGTLLANLFAMATAMELPTRLVLGFVDEELTQVLDLDGEREVTLSLIALGRGAATMPANLRVPRLGLETLPLSSREVTYPDIGVAHDASSLWSAEEVAAWRSPAPAPMRTATPAESVPLAPSLSVPSEPIEQVILRRGSTREFARDPIGFDVLSTVLRSITRGIGADFVAPGAAWNEVYLIVNAVAGLAPGAYAFDRDHDVLERLRAGDCRRQAGHLDLDQALAADAAVNLYWLVDLHRVVAHLGNRGYRAAQLEAAIGGGKAYLAAYALGAGATGLTFFDDEMR